MADNPPTIPSLTFTRPVFAKLSPHPYLLRNLSPPDGSHPGARTNGRSPHEARPVQINVSSLSHTHGSALVRTGDTTVICGVRGEILPAARIPQFRPLSRVENAFGGGSDGGSGSGSGDGRKELKDYDLLVPNIELATGSAPQFLPGVPPTALAQTLSTRVYSLLHSTGLVRGEALRVWFRPPRGSAAGEEGDDKMEGVEGGEGLGGEQQDEEVVAYWVLYIDLLFVSFDGNPFDAAWAAVVAALRDTKLPVARWDPDREMVVCSRTETRMLDVKGLPVACSAAVFLETEHTDKAGENRHWLLLDPDRLEESLCKEVITMVVDCSEGETRVKSVEKHGGTVLGRELIRAFTGVAEVRWAEVKQAMK
ncbi:Exosome complex component rrp43 [Madurella mycetomatis]|uniref:Ribosomal RNA-processing protein 43 n=1 Tax=Madurella mycetomatis TaxID=100816 RepID=A0A175W6J7_9PEZI|nr:Exosome complex component rrp43 [Madurella mycetomatis]